jgi:hypothetical protein
MKDTRQLGSGVTFRALVIGTGLVIANAYWLTVTSELTTPQNLLTFVSLFFNAVFTLFVVEMLNRVVRVAAPSHALSAREMLVIYIMVVMVGTVGGHTVMCFLVGTVAHPFRFANIENQWQELIWPYIPQWMMADPNVLDGYFRGESTLYTRKHLMGWSSPVAVWTVFIGVIWYMLICINSMIRAQWTEHEKLAYPIIQLPLRMVEEGSAFHKNGIMWAGFGVAGLFELLAGLNYLNPAIPSVRLNYYSIEHWFTEKPWSSIDGIALSAFPFIIGLTFFVPLELSMSAWLFFLLGKAERIVRMGMLGAREIHFEERAGGAWIAVGVIALWRLRRQLVHVVVRAIRGGPRLDDRDEPMSYRAATLGLLGGFVFLTWFSMRAGMSLWGVVGFLVFYLLMSLAVARVRAELGPPSHEILWLDPARLMADSFGPKNVGAANLTVLSLYYWMNRLNVAHPMPNQLEAFKMAERVRISNRRLVRVMIFATVVGTVASFWTYLHVLYQTGAANSAGFVVGIGHETFGRLERWIVRATGPEPGVVGALGSGFSITAILYLLKGRFVWWPLHPIGYVMTAATWGGLADIWFSVFLGWAIKITILKQAGFNAHRAAVPFFLGLVFGDYVVTGAWSVIGLIFHIPTYVLWSP